MSPEAELRYARLLWLYPTAYRQERGGEMLATLAEADRPIGRESAALIMGALRARTGLSRFTSPGRLWLSALRLAALVLVAQAAAQAVAHVGDAFTRLLDGRGLALACDLANLGAAAFGVLALLALATGRYAIGAALSTGAFVCHVWAAGGFWTTDKPFAVTLVDGELWQLPLALLIIAVLIRRPPPGAARRMTWLLAVPAAVLLLPTAFDSSLRWQPYPLLVLGAAALLWTMIDARAAVAASTLFLAQLLPLLGFYAPSWANGRIENLPYLITYTALAVALLAAGAGFIRRQARL